MGSVDTFGFWLLGLLVFWLLGFLAFHRGIVMTTRKPSKLERDLEAASVKPRDEKYVLRLYIAGTTPHSSRAILNIKTICEEHLKGRYDLEVIDIYQQPTLARGEQILAAPTLIKQLPVPLRKFIGDMSNTEKILVGLDLRPKDGKETSDSKAKVRRPAKV
jgi:circadian clock protein KaiB